MSTLLIEEVDLSVIDNEILEESVNGKKQRAYYIKGCFMQADIKNQNGRIYPRPVLEREVEKAQKKIQEGRFLGELDHPNSLDINLERVAMKIIDLKMNNNITEGKAKIIDTPLGKVAKSLIDEGVKLGVSSRGAGSLKETAVGNVVQNDYQLITIDIVHEPSAPSAFVDGIVESKMEWLIQENLILPKTIEEVNDMKDNFKKYGIKDVKEATIRIFNKILNEIKNINMEKTYKLDGLVVINLKVVNDKISIKINVNNNILNGISKNVEKKGFKIIFNSRMKEIESFNGKNKSFFPLVKSQIERTLKYLNELINNERKSEYKTMNLYLKNKF